MIDGMAPRSHRIVHQLARFLAVGGVGFAVDVGVLAFLLYGLDYAATSAGLVGSRIVSFLAAIAATFLLNARYTFGVTVRDSRLARYVTVQILGAALNLGVYTFLTLGPLGRPLIALTVGSAVATVSNFILARRFVYAWR
jgi:putative flippase GtrA